MLIAVAGPYSADSEEKRAANLDAMNGAAAKIYMKGHIPVIGVNAALAISKKLESFPPSEVINKISFAIVEKCDAILIIGSSPGADEEREIIEIKRLPVYTSIDEVPYNNLQQ
ncbi:MAG TPA: NUDIX hydrolase [Ignavibacteria bacterium]|jgi:hypothetical protein